MTLITKGAFDIITKYDFSLISLSRNHISYTFSKYWHLPINTINTFDSAFDDLAAGYKRYFKRKVVSNWTSMLCVKYIHRVINSNILKCYNKYGSWYWQINECLRKGFNRIDISWYRIPSKIFLIFYMIGRGTSLCLNEQWYRKYDNCAIKHKAAYWHTIVDLYWLYNWCI